MEMKELSSDKILNLTKYNKQNFYLLEFGYL